MANKGQSQRQMANGKQGSKFMLRGQTTKLLPKLLQMPEINFTNISGYFKGGWLGCIPPLSYFQDIFLMLSVWVAPKNFYNISIGLNEASINSNNHYCCCCRNLWDFSQPSCWETITDYRFASIQWCWDLSLLTFKYHSLTQKKKTWFTVQATLTVIWKTPALLSWRLNFQCWNLASCLHWHGNGCQVYEDLEN